MLQVFSASDSSARTGKLINKLFLGAQDARANTRTHTRRSGAVRVFFTGTIEQFKAVNFSIQSKHARQKRHCAGDDFRSQSQQHAIELIVEGNEISALTENSTN